MAVGFAGPVMCTYETVTWGWLVLLLFFFYRYRFRKQIQVLCTMFYDKKKN